MRDRDDSVAGEVERLIADALKEAWADVPARDGRRVATHRAAFIAGGLRRAHPRARVMLTVALRYASVLLLALASAFMSARVMAAASLPGDDLYTVKLSVESVEGLLHDREEWGAEQEARRVREVLSLAARSGRAPVSFIASPIQGADGGWYIGTVPLVTSADQSGMLENRCPEPRAAVRIFGQVRDGRIYATAVTPGCLFIAAR